MVIHLAVGAEHKPAAELETVLDHHRVASCRFLSSYLPQATC